MNEGMGISNEDDACVPLLFNQSIGANHESWAAAMAKPGQSDPGPLLIRGAPESFQRNAALCNDVGCKIAVNSHSLYSNSKC